MTRQIDFMARLRLPPALPGKITDLKIETVYSEAAHGRGVPDRIASDLDWLLEDIGPLFGAGFAAADPSDPALREARLSVKAAGARVQLSLTGALHRPMAAYLLLKLVETANSTPQGAYERLVDMMDGDEEAAADAFNPKHITDIASVTLMAEGEGPHVPFAYDAVPLPADLVPLAADISAQEARQIFALARDAALRPEVDHGFLAMQNAGAFQAPYAEYLGGAEPEIFLADPRQLVVDGWEDAGFGLAELLWLLNRGSGAGIVKVSHES